MTRDQVIELSTRVHGSRGFPGNVATDFANAQKEIDSGAELIWFADSATLCIGQGNLYHIHFDHSDRLTFWTISRWEDTC